MVKAIDVALQALSGKYDGIKYEDKDCQAFVELVLKDAGLRNGTGKPFDWRGSNHMWRVAVEDRTPNDGKPPIGAFVFTIKNDGGEKARGYNDNMGNASHVGLYCGGGVVKHSTTPDGVQTDKISSKRWTHYAKCIHLDYDNNYDTAEDKCLCACPCHKK